jgi:hypothetical protein
MHISALIRDRSDLTVAIAERLDASFAAIPQDQYLLPDLWLLEGYVDIALYEQNPSRAWALVETDWPAFSRSSHRWLEYADVYAHYLRARSAIAIAATTDNPQAYTSAAKCLRELDRHPVAWARAFSAMVRAGLASLTADSQTIALLETAEQQAQVASMQHCVAACRYRRGTLMGGVAGGELVAAAERWAQEQAIVRPSPMFDVFLPGRWA